MATSFRTWFLETRPHFLLLTPVSVFLGLMVALWEVGSLNIGHALLAFLGAVLAHTSVNVLNDYFDYTSGLDLKTVRTPFSGGSGILPAGLLSPKGVYLFGLGCLLALIPIGMYFTLVSGWGLLPLGVVGLGTIYFYTRQVTRLPLPCLIAPGLGFGPLMVLGVYYTQAGSYSWAAGMASLIPGFLVSGLLLLNQFPDVEADAQVGRRHYPVTLGRQRSAWLFVALIIATYAWLVICAFTGLLLLPALAGLLTLPLGIKLIKGVLKYHHDLGHLVPLLGLNVQVVLFTPFIAGLGILAGVALG